MIGSGSGSAGRDGRRSSRLGGVSSWRRTHLIVRRISSTCCLWGWARRGKRQGGFRAPAAPRAGPRRAPLRRPHEPWLRSRRGRAWRTLALLAAGYSCLTEALTTSAARPAPTSSVGCRSLARRRRSIGASGRRRAQACPLAIAARRARLRVGIWHRSRQRSRRRSRACRQASSAHDLAVAVTARRETGTVDQRARKPVLHLHPRRAASAITPLDAFNAPAGRKLQRYLQSYLQFPRGDLRRSRAGKLWKSLQIYPHFRRAAVGFAASEIIRSSAELLIFRAAGLPGWRSPKGSKSPRSF